MCLMSIVNHFLEIESSVFTSNILIGVTYRPPNTDRNCFIDIMKETLLNISKENKVCYLLGDYNIHLLNIDYHELTCEFNNTLYINGVIPLITRPTRVSNNSATLIDNIFTNHLLNQEQSFNAILLTEWSLFYQWKDSNLQQIQWFILSILDQHYRKI